MKKKLAEIFKGKCMTVIIPDDAGGYYWYLDEENKPIGISKDISRMTRELIELNYISIGVNNLFDIEKLLWLKFLIGDEKGNILVNTTGATNIKFIFFFHDFDTELQQEFEALVQGFNNHFMVFFLEPEYGVLLDLSLGSFQDDEVDDVEDFLLASKQDFSDMLTFYQTINYEINNELPKKFKAELDLFKKYKDTNRSLMKYKDIFLNYISADTPQHPIFADWFKQIFLIDTQVLAVVKCYLEYGFNVTMGAKVMYMHRNTFMNKLDRFTHMTGLDIKNFDEAAIAYLLIRQILP